MERNKTLTALAGTEPGVGSTHPQAQKLQWVLSEPTGIPVTSAAEDSICCVRTRRHLPPRACWSSMRLGIAGGTKTAHVDWQYLGSIDKVDQGVVLMHRL